jgi:hypothetical protein
MALVGKRNISQCKHLGLQMAYERLQAHKGVLCDVEYAQGGKLPHVRGVDARHFHVEGVSRRSRLIVVLLTGLHAQPRFDGDECFSGVHMPPYEFRGQGQRHSHILCNWHRM